MYHQPLPRPALDAVRLLLADRGRDDARPQSGGKVRAPGVAVERDPGREVDSARRALWQQRLSDFTRGRAS